MLLSIEGEVVNKLWFMLHCSNEHECTTAIHTNIDESSKHNVEQKMQVAEYIWYSSINV